ncbi:MAG TPA: hypothetical protein VHC40_14000 [Rhizomicrobium sp.]|jgi:hypothetical protein|nr:hypothetical protein [Rhizomicrobium sp.]
MYIFLYLLAAMGVAYWAKIHGRNPAIWFTLAMLLTPLGGSVMLMLSDRFGVRF